MANINEILARAAALRDETALNSISPERAGSIMYDTLIALNELWLQQGAALVISKIYASVDAMEADTAPVSDISGKPLRPGQIVVIASEDEDNGSVYRYNGPDSPSWSLVGNIGNLEPVDSLDSDSTQLPLAAHQGKVLDGKISQLGQEIENKTPKEVVLEDAEQNVSSYLVDARGVILARIKTDGSIERTMPNSADIKIANIEDFLTYVSSEVADGDNGVVKYITDKDGKILATIDNVGTVKVYGGGGFCGEETREQFTNLDAVKIITDNNNNIIGWITTEGKIHLVDAVVEHLEVKNSGELGVPETLWPILGMVASGVSNRLVVNDKVYNLLKTVKTTYYKGGVDIQTEPCITLYDDDAIDNQLPTSYNGNATPETEPSSSLSKKGGYASVLFPMIHAFNAKYKNSIRGKVTVFSAAEGQRIGLTKLRSYGDEFAGTLNNNGQVLKRLISTGEWEALCHSMTARYDSQNYLVSSLDSSFANEVLSNGAWEGDLDYATTTCYNEADGKNYQIKQDKSGWTELPLHYAKPYCATSLASNSTLVINPTYSPKYQVNEWFRRADIAGLPYSMKGLGRRSYANWGNSHSIWHIKENLKWADYGFGGTAGTNGVPVDSVVHRLSYQPSVSLNPSDAPYHDYTGDFNVYTEAEYKRLTDMIDECVEKGGWSVLGGHANTMPCANYYFPGLVEYTPSGASEPINLYDNEPIVGRLNYYDADYPEEWIVPLKYEELQDIIGENTHDYLNHPPARLEIDSWDEWYPCPGTGLALLWDALKYAVGKGVTFITAEDGFQMFGNLVTIGFHFTNGEVFSEDMRLGDIPEEDKSYCIIGADGSVNYDSKNN